MRLQQIVKSRPAAAFAAVLSDRLPAGAVVGVIFGPKFKLVTRNIMIRNRQGKPKDIQRLDLKMNQAQKTGLKSVQRLSNGCGNGKKATEKINYFILFLQRLILTSHKKIQSQMEVAPQRTQNL